MSYRRFSNFTFNAVVGIISFASSRTVLLNRFLRAMNFVSSSKIRIVGFYLLLIVFACLPIWSVERYFNQDGSPHLYNAYMMLELFKDNPAFTQFFEFNPAPIPNLSGHYLLVFLLLFFSPPIVTKIMVSLLYAAFVASVGWLRKQVVGQEDFQITLLIGAALGFNWMWFLGFYNFLIGVVGFVFTLGLYWRWRENLNFSRSLVLAVLLIVVYFSHLISFGMLAGSIVLFSLFVSRQNLKRAVFWTFASLLPVLPLIINYKLLSAEGGEIAPVWRYLENPLSLSNWFSHLQAADPFQLISRKAIPFFTGTLGLFAILSPTLWLTIAFFCLAAATIRFNADRKLFTRQTVPFFLILTGAVLVWIFAPDDFGKTHGGFLRERVLFCGLICFIPLFHTGASRFLKYAATACLIFVLGFQSLVLWNYASVADKSGAEFLSGQSALTDDDSLGSIVLTDTGCRFKANPLPSMGVLYGIGKNTRMWDNYEAGFYVFPTVLKNPNERRFLNEFRESSNFDLCDSGGKTADKFVKLNSILLLNNDKIKVILIWGDDERILPIINQWYENQPFFQNGKIRLFRHR